MPSWDAHVEKHPRFPVLRWRGSQPFQRANRQIDACRSISLRPPSNSRIIDKVDPNTGQVFPGDNRAAQFQDGRFETKDLFDVRGIYRSDAMSAGRIWDQDTENAKQREGAYKNMKSMLLGDPDFKKRFLEEMKAELAEDDTDVPDPKHAAHL